VLWRSWAGGRALAPTLTHWHAGTGAATTAASESAPSSDEGAMAFWQQSHRSLQATHPPIQPDCSEQAETQTKADSTGRAATEKTKRRLHLKPAGRAAGMAELHTSSSRQSLLALLSLCIRTFALQSRAGGPSEKPSLPPSMAPHLPALPAAFSFLGSSARRMLAHDHFLVP